MNLAGLCFGGRQIGPELCAESFELRGDWVLKLEVEAFW